MNDHNDNRRGYHDDDDVDDADYGRVPDPYTRYEVVANLH